MSRRVRKKEMVSFDVVDVGFQWGIYVIYVILSVSYVQGGGILNIPIEENKVLRLTPSKLRV